MNGFLVESLSLSICVFCYLCIIKKSVNYKEIEMKCVKLWSLSRRLVKYLDDHTDCWTILVRVFRRWNMYQRAVPKDLAAICMVLIDEEVNVKSWLK